MALLCKKLRTAHLGIMLLAIITLSGAAYFSEQSLQKVSQNNLAFSFKVRERLLIGYMGVACNQLTQNSDPKERHAITIHFMTNVTRLEHLFAEAGLHFEKQGSSLIASETSGPKLSATSIEVLNRARVLALKADSESNTLDRNDSQVLTMYNLVRAEIERLDLDIYAFQSKHIELIENSQHAQKVVWIVGIFTILAASLLISQLGKHD